MAKRGESRPWKVRYEWDNGVKGTVACTSEDGANFKADQIRRASEFRDDASVSVVVELVVP